MIEMDLYKEMKVIVFQLLDKEYAMPVDYVMSIERVPYITRVPSVPDYVKGVINLKGMITPIIDLRMKFGVSDQEMNETTRVIIVSFHEMEVGLIVDAANDVLTFSTDLIESNPDFGGTQDVDFISGIVKLDNRLLILIKLDQILKPLNSPIMK